MIVIDASVLAELILRTKAASAIRDRLLTSPDERAAPHLIDVEVTQVIRRNNLTGQFDDTRAGQAMQDLASFPMVRFPHWHLIRRIWELRRNLTAHDATYIALAESLDATLLTRDRRLASIRGCAADVEVM